MLWILYAFFWVIPQHLKFICQHFGTLCLFHLHRQVVPAYEDGTDRVVLPAYEDGTDKVVLPAYEDGTDRVVLPAYEDGTDRVFRNVGI